MSTTTTRISPMPRVLSFERAHNRAKLLPLPCPAVYNGSASLYRLNNTYRGFDYVVVSHSFHVPESLLFGCGPDGDACAAGWVELAGTWFQQASDSSLLEEIGYYLEDEVAA